MKIAVLADIHGNIFALEEVLQNLKLLRIDKMFCLGDMIGYYPFPNEVLETCLKKRINLIKGNHEVSFLGNVPCKDDNELGKSSLNFLKNNLTAKNKRILATLPKKIEIEENGQKILFCHGSPWDVNEYLYPNNLDPSRFKNLGYDIIFFGHTHYACMFNIMGISLINPGSCGQPRDKGGYPSFVLFDTKTYELIFRRIPYETEKLEVAIIKNGLNEILIKYLKNERLR